MGAKSPGDRSSEPSVGQGASQDVAPEVAISASQAIAQFGAFDLPGYDGLAEAVRRLGPGAVIGARAAAAKMSYDEAMACVFDGIDRLITEHETTPTGGQPIAPERRLGCA